MGNNSGDVRGLQPRTSTGSVEIDLIGRNTDFLSNDVIAGKFMVLLQAGEANGMSVPASIAQTGLVPAGSLSLQFAANVDLPDFAVTFNGQNIPIQQLTSGPNYQLQEYGCDISTYAGHVGVLQFSAEPNDFPFANVYLDAIKFSNLCRSRARDGGVVGRGRRSDASRVEAMAKRIAMKSTFKRLAVIGCLLGAMFRLNAQGYIVPNGVVTNLFPGEIDLSWPEGNTGQWTYPDSFRQKRPIAHV